MAGPDIFLSYNREDADVARRFAEGFEAQGFDVWWDQALRSGEAYDKVTEAALRGAKAVVVLWSPRSVDSRWVRAEATIAERNGTLAPVRIESCDLPVMFELTQTADLSGWNGAADNSTWLAFLKDVRRMVGLEPKSSTDTPLPPSRVAAGDGMAFVAVLPLSSRGGGDMELVAEDLTDDITRELARNRLFNLIAAGTMATWRGKPVDYRALAQETDARYIVEGKLQPMGETMRLTVQLIDVRTTSSIWSHRISLPASQLASESEKIAASVASEVGEHIHQAEIRRALAFSGPYSAWDHVLRAMSYAAHLTLEDVLTGEREARLAVEAEPGHAFANALLATSITGAVLDGFVELDEVRRQEIQKHATRAMQLDGENAMLIAWLVMSYCVLEDGDTALRLARRAAQLNPNSPTPLLVVGLTCVELGRTAEAIEAFLQEDRMASLDPGRFLGLTHLGICYLLEGQPDKAEAAIDRSLALHPDYHITLKWKALMVAGRGDDHTALRAIRRLREVQPGMTIDQHVRQIERNRNIADRTVKHVATLRRLWEATEPDS